MASPGNEGDQQHVQQPGGYEKQHPRINKPDMFMNTALWMEMSPFAESPSEFCTEASEESQTETYQGKPLQQETFRKPTSINKVGAVVVLPNDRALSVDCSRNGVHAAVSALNKFGQERAKGCQVYLSRRPCSFCAKLLVQCEVSKVFYLPIEPERNDQDDVCRVDKIFKASSTGLSVFIPKISENVIGGQKQRQSPFTAKRNEENIESVKQELMDKYWNSDWVLNANDVLGWTAFQDTNMKEQTIKDMTNLMGWIARATSGDVPKDVQFVQIDPETNKAKQLNFPTGEEGSSQTTPRDQIPRIPTPNDSNWQKHALHMIRLAQMLSQRSDDPTRGVGCALMVHNEVVAIGWNGFPAKALYGEFPRASNTDEAREKKEPFVIHAEQNALLTRNKRNMNNKSSILFSNKVPCAECVPLLIQAGVKNVVVPNECDEIANAESKAFLKAVKEGKLTGYWPERPEKPGKSVQRDLKF